MRYLLIHALVVGCLCLSSTALQAEHSAHAENLFGRASGERIEYREDDGGILWDLQGSYGGDYRQLVVKTEGVTGTNDDDHAELQLLYSYALTPWFDLQTGLRWLDTDEGDKLFVAAGLQGLLPYRIETDIALFVTSGGGPVLRAEFERDLFLSESLVLQPRVEINAALDDLPDTGTESGLDEASIGLRLRYEITRKLAPYIGIAWDYGKHGDEGSSSDASLVAGVRFWF